MKAKKHPVNPELDLVLERVVDVPRHLVWKAWTTPELMKQWFAPRPWTTPQIRLDLYPGGAFNTTMKSPEGQEYPSQGCVLEVIENERLAFTSALSEGFRPTGESFMTAIITLEDHPQGTKYTAHAVHKNKEDRKTHEDMGFMTGWGICVDQLVELVKKGI
ncbi:polyketide cyclase [Bdellovibrio bacteriovorus]|uniref:Polyketide cyclase n=1 Tax=Bdellovibrio bacteriovorus TaxID=959 RepID=A0A150WVY8_BDEBC|nr:SRPBCC family protein [Bdellovibrio bacteriovorus]KYG70621.1 polyketide cyclase [Bdellovibrio bacteriovorus]